MLTTDAINPHNKNVLRAIKWVIIALGLAAALAGIILFSRNTEKGENYISLQAKVEAQNTGRDPCDILQDWLNEAKQTDDIQQIRDIQTAEKFLGCRNKLKRSERNPMSWYAAHAVMYVRFKDDQQESYPFWENILLIEANSDEEALAKATQRAKEDEGDSRGTFTWLGRPAQWCFAGIRKLTSCEDSDNKPGDGTEITYLEMEVSDEDDFSRFINGEPVVVRYL